MPDLPGDTSVPEPAIRHRAARWTLPAGVVAVAIDGPARMAALGLGDGTVHLLSLADGEEARTVEAHDGAVLALIAADGGFLSAGDDGRIRRILPDGVAETLLAERRWITHLDRHPGTGVVVAAAGKAVLQLDRAGALVRRYDDHPSTVTGVALNPTGKQFAASHYNGVTLWWTGPAKQTPRRLAWKGSHIALAWAPNGKHLMTAMQDNELHGWRIADSAAMRMAGMASKAKSLAWSADGRWLANSGSEVVTCWDFAGKGPMGKPPTEICPGEGALVTAVAIHPKAPIVAAGYADGTLRLGRPGHPRSTALEPVGPAPVVALAWSPAGDVLVAGAEDGGAALCAFPSS